MDLIAFYMLFFMFCGAIAWFFSGFRFVQRLDDNVLILFGRLEKLLLRTVRRGRG